MLRIFFTKLKFIFVILPLLFASCKNPFDESFYGVNQQLPDNCSGNAPQVTILPFAEDSENIKLQSDEEMAYVEIKLAVEFLDVEIKCIAEENEIFLETSAGFDSYWWFMSDKLLGESESCRVDFTDFVENVYPIVLFASKDSVMYSGMINVAFADGQLSIVNFARTIQPFFYPAELVNLSLKITNNGKNISSVLTFLNYTELSKKIISLNPDNYTFEITGEIKSLKFTGLVETVLSKGKTKLEVPMQSEKYFTEGFGSLQVTGMVNSEYQIDEGLLCLYHQINGKFEKIKSLFLGEDFIIEKNGKDGDYEYSYNFNFSFENLPTGTYWLRLDAGNQENHKSCYYADYTYVVPDQKSVKNIILSDFYDYFVIKYECNEGIPISNIKGGRFSSFDTIELPDENSLFKMGNKFCGWYYDPELTVYCGTVIEAGILCEDTVLYAKWESITNDDILKNLLPENENIKVLINGNKIEVVAKHQNSELFILDLENSVKNSLEIKIQGIEIMEDLVIITAVIPELEHNYYNLVLSGLYNNQLVFSETQIIRLY